MTLSPFRAYTEAVQNYVLWIRRPDKANNAWLKALSASTRRELWGELRWRKEQGFEAVILLKGVHPEELASK